MIISTDDFKENEHIYLGTSPIYEGVKIKQIKDNIIPYNEVIGSYLLKNIN